MNPTFLIINSSVIIVGATIFWQIEKKADDPIVPSELFKDFPYLAQNLIMLFFALSIGYTVYTPMQAQSILGTNASLGGVTQILSSVTVILATRLLPSLLKKISYKTAVWNGFTSVSISAIILATANVDSSYWTIVISGGFMGFGQGMIMQPLQVAMQSEIKPEVLNIATTLSLLLRTLSMSFNCFNFWIATHINYRL